MDYKLQAATKLDTIHIVVKLKDSLIKGGDCHADIYKEVFKIRNTWYYLEPCDGSLEIIEDLPSITELERIKDAMYVK